MARSTAVKKITRDIGVDVTNGETLPAWVPAGATVMTDAEVEDTAELDRQIVAAVPAVPAATAALYAMHDYPVAAPIEAPASAPASAPAAVPTVKKQASKGAFVLDDHIEMPDKVRRGRVSSYPFDTMKVGQSFFVPDKTSAQLGSSAATAAKRLNIKLRLMKRVEQDAAGNSVTGVRIWRLEDETP